MAKFTVHYGLRNGTKTRGTNPKTVEAESEQTAIQIVQSQVESENPGWDFILRKVERK